MKKLIFLFLIILFPLLLSAQGLRPNSVQGWHLNKTAKDTIRDIVNDSLTVNRSWTQGQIGDSLVIPKDSIKRVGIVAISNEYRDKYNAYPVDGLIYPYLYGQIRNDTLSIREHSIIWHPVKLKYYMVADVIDTSNIYHPDTYDTELGLFSSSDLKTWTYHGICVEKGTGADDGQYGVASPSQIAFWKGRIYVAYSQRNGGATEFTPRDVGLAYSSIDNPETVPWTKVAGHIADADEILGSGAVDDDCALVAIPGDNYLHLYWRAGLAGVYNTYHSKSKTPADTSSWTFPNLAHDPPDSITTHK